ncbi:methyltransferase domain-containing protein [Sphingomonas sp.]|uniref:methyltransferase domain-containing protein n=1 Tax=Sphingomonas sp. TaxID=28214 RepID=UPI0025DF20C4|nr:methyltransferase domain-containing protein [Sphingomonas sp.]
MLEKRATAEELMDAPDLPAATYAAVLRDLATVNTMTMARRPTLDFLARALAGRKSFRLLDVGFGEGDMLRTVARWAAKRGIVADLVGIDLNPNSVAAGRAATSAALKIEYRAGDYSDLVGEHFDLIISSLVAHHMSHDQLITFLQFMDREARAGWFINDLHRHGFAWLGFPVLARLMRWHRIVRHDGQLSIARSYRPGEWPAILHQAGVRASIRRIFPFRLCVEAIR